MSMTGLTVLVVMSLGLRIPDYQQTFDRGVTALRARRFEEGIVAFETCLKLQPNQRDCAYNLACAHALLGHRDLALDWLETAVKWGYRSLVEMRGDADLESLREAPRFTAVVDNLRAVRVLERDARAIALEQEVRSGQELELRRASGPSIDWVAGHVREVHGLVFSSTGERLMSFAPDQTARVWDAQTGDLLLTLRHPKYLHGESGRSLIVKAAFSPTADRIVTLTGSGIAYLWDGLTGSFLRLFVDGALLRDVAFGPDGKSLACLSWDGTLSVWDLEANAETKVFDAFASSCFGWSPDGGAIAVAQGDRIRVVDLVSGDETELQAGVVNANFLHFAPSGLLFASTGPFQRTELNLAVFDPALAGEESLLATFRSKPTDKTARQSQPWVSRDGSLVMTREGTILRFLEPTAREIARLDLSIHGEGKIVLAADASWLAMTCHSHQRLHVWNLEQGRPLPTVPSVMTDPELPEAELPRPGDWMVVGAAGSRLAVGGGDGSIAVFDVHERERVFKTARSPDPICGAIFSPDGKRLAVCTVSGAREFDLTEGVVVEPVGHVRVGPGGNTLTVFGVGAYDWNHGPGSEPARLLRDGFFQGVAGITFSRDGAFATTWERTDVKSRSVLGVWDLTSNERHDIALRGPVDSIRIRFSPDASRVLVLQTDVVMNTALFDRRTAARLAELEARTDVTDAAFHPDGSLIVSASRDWLGTGHVQASGEIVLWRAEDLKQVAAFHAHDGGTESVDFSPHGRWLATLGMQDFAVKVWRASDHTLQCELHSDGGQPVAFAFSPDESRIAVTHEDGVVRLWTCADGRLLASFVPQENGDWLTFTPTNDYRASAAGARRAHLMLAGLTYPLSLFASTLEKPDRVRASLRGEVLAPARVLPPPSLEVLSPAQAIASVNSRRVSLRARAEDRVAGMQSMELRIDGVEVPPAELAKQVTRLENGRALLLERNLDITADRTEVHVSIQATNARGTRSLVKALTVRFEPPKRQLFLLAMGVSDYGDERLNLRYPVKDADDLIAFFREQAGTFYDKVNVRRLADADVSLARVKKARDDFLLRASEQDTIVVFIAGHGTRTETGEYWFLTKGASADEPYSGIDRGNLEELVTWRKLHARRRVLLMDTCYAGATLDERGDPRGARAFDQAKVDSLRDREGIYVLAAGEDDELAREQQGNGVFTRVLLDGLVGGADSNHDGVVDIEELKTFASAELHDRSGGRQHPTFPKVEGGESFPLAKVPPK